MAAAAVQLCTAPRSAKRPRVRIGVAWIVADMAEVDALSEKGKK